MSFTLIQLILIGVALLGAFRTVRQFKAGRVPPAWLAFWGACWIALAVVAFIPQTTDIAARLFGVGRGVDLAVYVSIVLLFALSFKLLMKIEDLERELTRLVRALALKDSDKTDHVA